MTVQVRDRRFKPLAHDADVGVIATDARWALRGLVSHVPLWRGLHAVDRRKPAMSFAGPQTLVGGARGSMINSTTALGQFAGSALGVPAGQFCTVICHYLKTDTTNRSSMAFGMTSTNATDRCDAAIPSSDGNVYFEYAGFTEGVTMVKATGLTFGDDTWAFTTGARGMEIWQNGVLRASNGATPSRTQGTQPFGPFRGVTVGSDNANMGVFVVYGRQLEPWEINQYVIDPWLLYRPPRRRFGFPYVRAVARAWTPGFIG